MFMNYWEAKDAVSAWTVPVLVFRRHCVGYGSSHGLEQAELGSQTRHVRERGHGGAFARFQNEEGAQIGHVEQHRHVDEQRIPKHHDAPRPVRDVVGGLRVTDKFRARTDLIRGETR